VENAPFSKDRAKLELNRCLDDGLVIHSRHFREELANDGLTMQDVLTVCRSGAVRIPREPDLKTGGGGCAGFHLQAGRKGRVHYGIQED
jgi:hypothetical protein